MRWGMVIDKLRCVQCYSCQVSCKQAYFLPPGIFFNRVATGETGQYPMVRKHTFPLLCNHCTDAPCVNVCPTGASYQREDGIVVIDSDKCVGCKYCIMACPYQQRTSFKYKEQYPGQGFNNYEKFMILTSYQTIFYQQINIFNQQKGFFSIGTRLRNH